MRPTLPARSEMTSVLEPGCAISCAPCGISGRRIGTSCAADRSVCDHWRGSTISSHDGSVRNGWIRSNNDKDEGSRRRQRAADEQLAWTPDSFEKILGVEQVLTAVRTVCQMILNSIALDCWK